MRVFIIEDVDTHECRVFKNRKKGIDTMYYKCKEWGAFLYTAVEVETGVYQYTTLDKLYNTDEETLNFLYLLSAAELCNIFEAYWIFQECDLEK